MSGATWAFCSKTAAVSRLSRAEVFRHTLHHLNDAQIDGLDAISPIEPYLSPGRPGVTEQLQGLAFARCGVIQWTLDDYPLHKRADHIVDEPQHVQTNRS